MKFGALVVDGRGKIGGHVASKNRGGAYLRTKVTPVNAQTSYQLGVRSRFTGFSQGWRALTAGQRDAWNAAVSDFQKTDIFGDLRSPTGFNLFQRLNNNLSVCGVAQINVPPLPSAVGAIFILLLEKINSENSFTIVFTSSLPANTAIKIYATAPLSAGKSFVKSEFRLILVATSLDIDSKNIHNSFVAKFGTQGLVGQKVFVKCIAVNIITGQTGTPSQNSIITLS